MQNNGIFICKMHNRKQDGYADTTGWDFKNNPCGLIATVKVALWNDCNDYVYFTHYCDTHFQQWIIDNPEFYEDQWGCFKPVAFAFLSDLTVSEMMDDREIMWAIDGLPIDDLVMICECESFRCSHVIDVLRKQNNNTLSRDWVTDDNVGKWLFSFGRVLSSKEEWLTQF